MRPMIVVILLLDLAVLVAAAWATSTKRPPDRRRPVWPILSVALVACASASLNTGWRHEGEPWGDMLQDAGLVLFGMAVMAILLALRERHDLDSAAP